MQQPFLDFMNLLRLGILMDSRESLPRRAQYVFSLKVNTPTPDRAL